MMKIYERETAEMDEGFAEQMGDLRKRRTDVNQKNNYSKLWSKVEQTNVLVQSEQRELELELETSHEQAKRKEKKDCCSIAPAADRREGSISLAICHSFYIYVSNRTREEVPPTSTSLGLTKSP